MQDARFPISVGIAGAMCDQQLVLKNHLVSQGSLRYPGSRAQMGASGLHPGAPGRKAGVSLPSDRRSPRKDGDRQSYAGFLEKHA